MKIAAIDPSVTNTGVCVGDSEPVAFAWKPPSKLRGIERIAWFRDQLMLLVREHPDLGNVLIEELPKGAKQAGVQERAELIGVFKLALHDCGVPFVEVNPRSVKVYASGNGNAQKDTMMAEAIRRFGYPGVNNDEADAFIIWHLGKHMAGEQQVALPKSHIRLGVVDLLGKGAA